MLASAIALLRERGAAAVTVDAVLTHSRCPRGSVYHHFPGGRAELMAAALGMAGDGLSGVVEQLAAGDPRTALHRFGDLWASALRDSDFQAGCPIVSAAVGGSPDDEPLRSATAAIFDRWHDALCSTLVDAGADADRAARLATMTVAAVEGAVVLCRSQRSTAPLDDVVAELDVLLATAVPAGP
ncbi:TetR/AcrR family transcriptional regulator [Mycolicibacillus trivialis]|uniref:TetR family transcriptional regulator n=1 Tax=Mycolicibacillus trivialis TaxID=1798 RepID=A0A1X2ELV1_9MYCO|nr:TetR/AcrR family transcriptional regulator [Mycolicibacillus trivialis]ORX06110.1 TetR family transcriptional regulator [Mycolicibacillus trivialis]